MGHRPVRAAFILMWSLHLRQRMFRRLSAELVQPSQLPSAHGPQARACWLERRYCILLRVCVFHQFHVYFESLSARGNLPRAVIFGNFLCTLKGLKHSSKHTLSLEQCKLMTLVDLEQMLKNELLSRLDRRGEVRPR